MTSAREAIFAAINTPSRPQPEIAREARALLDRVPALRPDRVSRNLADAFFARVTGPVIGASGAMVATMGDVPDAVRAYLSAHDLTARVALQPHPTLLGLNWPDIATHRDIAVDEPVAVGMAAYAVAETGSLVFRSGSDTPTLFAFLPLHHIVVVRAESVMAWLEDCAAAEAMQPAPRNLNLVTGASGTTDIEGALVRGAHGPGYLHIVLVQSPL